MVYGIRHHGPGSARAVLRALERDRPDAVAIEMPADLQPLLADVGDAGLVPPVALVAYNPKAVKQALYYPLARFSPEWVAMRWAAERDVPLHAIDLPGPLMLAPMLDATSKREGSRAMRVDPLGELARIAGYTDRERWWERTFELSSGHPDVFAAVSSMIAALREAHPAATDAECRLREMHMARSLLAIERAGAERIAVVCGAWHAPVLAKAERKKTARGYAAAKRGRKGPKLDHTWIPWTYERLRTGAGYGAGVASPVWYELLFDEPREAALEYLTRMARELRAEGHPASTAQVVDAVELLEQLLALRGLALPGIDEIGEAALGALADGSEARLALVRRRVESLGTTGQVPASFANLPLQRDLEAQLKAVRLGKPYRDMEPVEKNLDLRKPAHLAASQLLTQLLLLGIPFGERNEAAQGAKGTFRETWRLHWKPDFALSLLGAQTYGPTVREAATGALRHRLDTDDELVALTRAVDLAVLAGLFDELDEIARRIADKAAATVDVWLIAAALPPLLQVSRYSSLRVRDTRPLTDLVARLVPQLAAGLAQACSQLDDEAAYSGFTTLKRLQPYLSLLERADLRGLWLAAVTRVAYGANTHPLLAGFALRTLADAGQLALSAGFDEPSPLAKAFGAMLGTGVRLRESALFVEGFLYSSGLVLVHQPAVFALLDDWITRLEVEDFREILPALKRTFSQFPTNERRKLSALSRRLRKPSDAGDEDKLDPTPNQGDGEQVLAKALRGWLAPDGARP